MPSSGSGSLTPIGPGVPPSTIPAARPYSCISLARYVEITGVHECSFWGVEETDTPDYECHQFWTEQERQMIARYLAEAQSEIEQEISYPLCRTWITNELRPYRFPLFSEMGYVVAGGVMGETDISAAASVSFATEPTTIGPIATTLTDATEIHVYYPDSDREITPYSISISGGFLTIWIPRCRLVSPDEFNTSRKFPIDYTDVSKFTSTVDVKRIYNDVSTNATLIWPHSCTSGNLCYCSCGEYTMDGCIYVKNNKLGILDILPATYSAGSWASSSACCRGEPENVLLNYHAGMYPITYQAEDAIIRLAHSKMPEEPCGCDVTQRLWGRDRNTPEVLTRERLNCPFGLSDGAWIAWRFAQTMKLHRLGTSL